MLKKILKSVFIIFIIFAASMCFISPEASIAVKKSKNAGLEEEDLTKVQAAVDRLYKKVYSSSLFTPTDNDDLFESKIKIDSQIQDESPDETYDVLVYKLAYILQKREFESDAIDYYKTLMDKFPDSPYATKATAELKKLGVKIEDESEDEEY